MKAVKAVTFFYNGPSVALFICFKWFFWHTVKKYASHLRLKGLKSGFHLTVGSGTPYVCILKKRVHINANICISRTHVYDDTGKRRLLAVCQLIDT